VNGRALVTGATGVIGRHTLRPLIAAGLEVHVAARRPVEVEGVVAHSVDLLDEDAVEALARDVGAAYLLHVAWRSVGPGVTASPENERWADASLALVRAFASAGGERAVLAGSCFEYVPDAHPCAELTTPTPAPSAYAVAKDRLRRALEEEAPALGLSFAWARIFFTYGPGEHPSRLVPSLALHALRGEPAAMSHGRQVRDYLHAADVGSALVHVLRSDVGGPVNIASGEAVTLGELGALVAAAAGRPDLLRVGAVPSPEGEPPVFVARVDRLRDEVGWSPSIALDDGIVETVRWWRRRLEAG
jgi:nucleoside-diphosphate-sugar epimerase